MSRRAIAVCTAAFALTLGVLAPGAALAWAPAGAATVHPGVQTETAGGQCTSNFVFRNRKTVYLGQAAHCSGTGEATETDGCTSRSRPLGTPVQIDGADKPGLLAYNSWITMQAKGETDGETCAYNDLALVRVDPADLGKINPSVPGFGGPTGVGEAGQPGATIYTYGNSSLRQGITKLSPKQGFLLESSEAGWSHNLYTLTPGIPGDSGSGFLNSAGQAFGVLSTVAIAPLPASNGVGDLRQELAYARAHTRLKKLHLVAGTQPFKPDLLGALAGS